VADLIKMFESMYLIRQAEEKMAKHYFENRIFSFVHFSTGQEGAAVGVASALEDDDRVYGNHRFHGHYLAKGGSLEGMFGEMLGKATGCCKGKGGSMHMLDRSVNFMGTTPILSSNLPISAGSALEQKMQSPNSRTVVFVGDGAAEEGELFETLNFASLMKLPLLIVIENNHFAVLSRHEDRKPTEFDLEKICSGFGVPYLAADGSRVGEVFDRTTEMLSQMQSLSKPGLLEISVYRHMAHSAPLTDDHLGLRTFDTAELRQASDPLVLARRALTKFVSEVEVQGIEDRVNAQIARALDDAINANEPAARELSTDVYF
jgi:TPP-dependent pyruvate/acetoin dehydrogenase alpha subunit